MSVTDDLATGKLLVVDNVKNNSGGNIQAVNATNTIIDSVNSISALQTVPYAQMMSARKALGLSGEDSLGIAQCGNWFSALFASRLYFCFLLSMVRKIIV